MTITIILYIIILLLLLYYLFNNTYEYYSYNNNIPKIIIQTWKTHDIPDKYKDDIQSIKDHNKYYNIMLFGIKNYELSLYLCFIVYENVLSFN